MLPPLLLTTSSRAARAAHMWKRKHPGDQLTGSTVVVVAFSGFSKNKGWGAQSRGLIRIFDFFSADQQTNIPRVFCARKFTTCSFLGWVYAARGSKLAPRSRKNFPYNWYPVLEMGQFFILRSKVQQEYNGFLVNALNRIFKSNLSLNNLKWLLTKVELSCVRNIIPRSI